MFDSAGSGLERPLRRLSEFHSNFPDDAACLRALMVQHFGGTEILCPSCKARSRFHAMTKRRAYACQECGYHIYPCAGTVLHRTRGPLSRLLFALHLLASKQVGSAAELERLVGCSYKTALRITKTFQRGKAEDGFNITGPTRQNG